MEFIAALFGSTGFGTIIGLAGSLFTRWDERKKQAQAFDQEHKLALLRVEEQKLEQNHELAMADKEMERAEVESATVIAEGELNAFAKSIEIGNSKSGDGFVNGFNSLMRPILTIYLLIISTWFTYLIYVNVGGLDSLNEEETQNLFKQVIMTFLFLASTAVTWWFGARPTSVKK